MIFFVCTFYLLPQNFLKILLNPGRFPWLSLAVPGCPWLSWAVLGCPGLSWAVRPKKPKKKSRDASQKQTVTPKEGFRTSKP